jgi:transketolase
MNSLLKLREHGQSYWLDNLTRKALRTGELARRVEHDGLCGVTSNPKTFHDAIVNGPEYREEIDAAARRGLSAEQLYETLVVADVQMACDVLRPVYDSSKGADGFVSLEVSPYLAHDTEASIAEARRLAQQVARPNLMIKIPGTKPGIQAVEQLLFEGLNVNVTLLFSVERYLDFQNAYLSALERRLAAGRSVSDVRSVASFFLSRIDLLVDRLLEQRPNPVPGSLHPRPRELLGKAAIASAKLAYQSFRALLGESRWKQLAEAGAAPQRLLWASTGTKNPAYRDVMYVEPLIGPFTINTMPERTISAFADHGQVKDTLEQDIEGARECLTKLEALSIQLRFVAEQLENEGVEKFTEPYRKLLAFLDERRHQLHHRGQVKPLEGTANILRRDVIRMTTQAGSGHPSSCLSCADLIAALFFHAMRWDPAHPQARNVDTFVLSKGHAAPILWAALAEASAISEDLLTLRRIDSNLEGHPTPRNPWVRVATGSLGQGLAFANGIALANRLDGIDARVYCLLGDGECSEGSVWEAAQFASLNRLSNLVALVDVNELGQSGLTPYRGDTSVYERRFAAFGWKTITLDGHSMLQILDALHAAEKGGPTALIARTVKGKGVSFLEGEPGWHGKALDPSQMQRALEQLGEPSSKASVEQRRVGVEPERAQGEAAPIHVEYEQGAQVATRMAYGAALQKLGAVHPEMVVLDGDVKDSTGEAYFAEAYHERFFECYIAEQNMAGVALGLASSGKLAYTSTFACFLTRAHDFIRMAGHSRPEHLIFCGSHAGVSIGEDGPSQMGLEDLAMFRAILGSTVLYPCDAVSAERLTETAAKTKGIVYIRTTRPKTPVLYANDEAFPVGGSKLLRASDRDRLTIIAAGITVHEALAAWEALREKGIFVRVLDAYSVKPIDEPAIRQAARETARLLVVEDHAYEGGLGDAVAAASGGLAELRRLAVSSEPRSGPSAALLELHGISRHRIAAAAITLLSGQSEPEQPGGDQLPFA